MSGLALTGSGKELVEGHESDCLESAVAKLFASAKRRGMLVNMVLLVAACRTCHLKERFRLLLLPLRSRSFWFLFYGATVKQMALRQLISQHSSEIGATCMLDEWEENLASITANRTKDDELVVIHLGDCLWKERGEECCVWILLSTAHRVVGGLPPSVPSTSLSGAQCNEHDHQKVGPRVSNSQSTMAMPSLMPSASTESEWKGGNNRSMHNRSISELDFGKTPRKEGSSLDMQEKASGAGGSSRLGRIGSQIFQKTVGLVLRSRSDRQAKLGEKNKFYYDENLKR
ncbi:hypothetical protein LOK49_LG03G02582 [Camellia lanceoleosa]|uniref:Uncharacterized protein n=1 Tax=Camellia lanceoleosa TaxID=1840588 RepID=A0ACC0IAU1_9ERIC|nr:hypothetical protein LOK49_LG03G02582 [Camellia lanceoleosa]